MGGAPTIGVFFEPGNSAIVYHFSSFITPWCVDHLADRDLPHVARDDTIHEACRIFAGKPVLEERRDVDQRGGVANGVVLVFVMWFVRTDRVISRPVAVVETFTQRKCSFVKSSSNGHVC